LIDRKCTPSHQPILLTAGDERPEVVVQAAAKMAHRKNRLNMFKRAANTTVSPILAGIMKTGATCVPPLNDVSLVGEVLRERETERGVCVCVLYLVTLPALSTHPKRSYGLAFAAFEHYREI